MARTRTKLVRNLTDEEFTRCYNLNYRQYGMMQVSLAQQRRERTDARVFMVEDDGKLISWALVFPYRYRNEGGYYEAHFYTRKTHRRKGYASRCMKQVLKRYGHDIHVSRWDSRGFFETFGF